jgi:hypothetical protein
LILIDLSIFHFLFETRKIIAKFVSMKAIIIKCVFFLWFLFSTILSFPQCQILNRVAPDGSMQYYMEPVNFYWTKAKSLQGCIVTDKENYFLEMHPLPFPEKPGGNKLKNDLILKLSDGNTYELDHYDTRYTQNDTVMELLYLIDKADMDPLLNFEVIEAKIIRTYVFKLHKSALKEQLACFLAEEDQKKKKK